MLRIFKQVPSLVAGLHGALGARNGLLSRAVLPVMSEPTRNYWGKEGRIGWRRKRAKERAHREQIMTPLTPLIDRKFPLPKDDMESVPADLFAVPEERLSPEELRNSQNAIVASINNQISDRSHGRLFAVVHVSGKQFKVTPEDIIIVQDSFAPTIGDQIRLHKVLLVGGKDFTLLGAPLLDPDLVRIEATVIEKTLSYTKLNFKMIKREHYRRLKFFKTPYTMLRINMIELMQPLNAIKTDAETVDQRELTGSSS